MYKMYLKYSLIFYVHLLTMRRLLYRSSLFIYKFCAHLLLHNVCDKSFFFSISIHGLSTELFFLATYPHWLVHNICASKNFW